MNLHEIHRGVHKHKKGRRVGRGPGSGRGKTSGRGGKGQRARAGYAALSVYQGGTMPLVRRVPKRGFGNSFALEIGAVNVAALDRAFGAGDVVNVETLRTKGLLKHRYDELKILGDGELTKSLTVATHRCSRSAREKIERAGGSVTILAGRKSAAAEAPRDA